MARALLLVFACAGAAAAAGARYSDYASVKMPSYGAADYEARDPAPLGDDYHEQAPDAPAPLDYKYEEIDTSDKMDKYIPNDVEDDDSWKKPIKKVRKQKNLDDADPEAYKIDEVVPKYQAKSRSKNRAQYRNKSKVRSDELLSRRYRTDDENRQMDTDDEDVQTQSEDLNGGNSLEHEDVNSKFARKQINKKIRRKPRDRPNLETRIQSDVEDEDSMSDVKDIQKLIRGSNRDYPDEVEDEKPRIPDVVARDQLKARPDSGEGDPQRVPEQSRSPPSPRAPLLRAPLPPRAPTPQPTYKTVPNEYADYYDMKRVQNIKSKLPPLLRRTKATVMARTQSRRVTPWRARKPNYRRKNIPPVTLKNSSAAVSTDYTTATVTIGTSAPQSVGAENMPKELSIAEKSRLSILKKAQRKESWNNGSSTNKPPVLLQVTQRLHTVVIVEPPMAQDPWLRAKEISDDSSERLEKVKRLMRHKLVSNAKNIRDLTDNWNELVCDYVDVALIDGSSAPSAPTTKLYSHLSLTLSVACFLYCSLN